MSDNIKLDDYDGEILVGLSAVLAFSAGKTVERDYAYLTWSRGKTTGEFYYLVEGKVVSGVKFTDGTLLVVSAYDEAGYSELTPGAGTRVYFYALRPR